MKSRYDCFSVSEIESDSEFISIQQKLDNISKSLWAKQNETRENVAKDILNVFGYPNNIELYTYQNSNKTEFVDVKTNTILACVDLVNDGTVFYIETKYFGDWYKC